MTALLTEDDIRAKADLILAAAHVSSVNSRFANETTVFAADEDGYVLSLDALDIAVTYPDDLITEVLATMGYTEVLP